MADDLRLDRYLERIQLSGALAPDLDHLRDLHAAHVACIPFEGLDPLLGRPVRLDLTSLQSKLVEARRGGFCFEQNILFKAVLEAVGFDVTGLTARVRWTAPSDAPLGPRTHMLLRITLADRAYLADVEFGACLLDEPLEFKTGVEQRTRMGTYKLDDDGDGYALSAKQPAGWRVMYVFDLTPQIQSDYELGSWFASTHPLALFTRTLVMERVDESARYKLINRRFLIEARDGVHAHERNVADADALQDILINVFAIEPPVSAARILERLPT